VVWVDFCTQSKVIFTGMTNADGSIYVLQVPFAKLVEVNASNIVINEMSMLGYYCFYTHQFCCDKYLSHHHTGTQVTMA